MRGMQLKFDEFYGEKIIPENDSVRMVERIVKEMDLSSLYATYSNMGRPPATSADTLLMVMLYACMEGKYSSREIESACNRDINYIWLLNGEEAPNYHEICRFRSERLPLCAEELFYQLVKKLRAIDEIKYEHLFVDGTKIEANANKYSFVWAKAVMKYMSRLCNKLEKRCAELCNAYGIMPCEAEKLLEALEERIKTPFVHGRGKRKTQLQRDIEELREMLSRKAKYEDYQKKFDGRNSFSKTDPDATFMHMKEDHMRNGQLKPGYNIQIGVESEYIVGVGSFTNRTDVQTLIPFLNRIRKHTNRKFENIIADAGYESSENYLYLEENGQRCFIKPQNYEISKKRSYKADPYTVENMEYNAKRDEYTCPNGRKLKFRRESKKTTENGYTISTKYYSNEKCGRCPHRDKCHKSKKDYRTIQVNNVILEHRPKTLEALTTEKGTLLRMNRSIQVEGVFGVLKEDYGFRRFLTRGKKNIETQFFLLAFALNIEKLCNRTKKGRIGLDLFALNAS